MWVYARHHQTTQHGMPEPRSPWTLGRRRLAQSFGIDQGKIRRWRDEHGSGPGANAHAGRSASDQYDRVFRIAALNRQILVTKQSSAAGCGEIGGNSAPGSTAEYEAQRASLIEVLRATGRTA